MDGIPVKINEKYKPPRKLSLPACTLNRLNNVQFTSYNYDFSLETTVAEHMARLNKISRDEIDKRDVKSRDVPEKPVVYENGGGNEPVMLTPVPTPISSNTTSTANKTNIFKYSDFENDTSSPFDNEELKTLNDMEELAHVLGATSVSSKEETAKNVGNDWYGSPSQSQFYGTNYSMTSQPTHHCPVAYASAYNSYQNPGNYAKETEDNDDVSDIVKSLQEYLGQRKVTTNKPTVINNSVAFNNLNDQEQAIARRFGEMGFSLSRTTEAVQLFGTDESKIVEYLLLVQSFVDKGFTESQTLQALRVNQCDENGTDHYLNLLSQIMKLGFKEDEVINALARTGNDRDKALEILIP